MKSETQPMKVRVRNFFARQRNEHKPPPSIEEIRRQLGWSLGNESASHKSNRR